jgi:hypothetical protein
MAASWCIETVTVTEWRHLHTRSICNLPHARLRRRRSSCQVIYGQVIYSNHWLALLHCMLHFSHHAWHVHPYNYNPRNNIRRCHRRIEYIYIYTKRGHIFPWWLSHTAWLPSTKHALAFICTNVCDIHAHTRERERERSTIPACRSSCPLCWTWRAGGGLAKTAMSLAPGAARRQPGGLGIGADDLPTTNWRRTKHV